MHPLRSCSLLSLLTTVALAQEPPPRAPGATAAEPDEAPRTARIYDVGDLLAKTQRTGTVTKFAPTDLKGKVTHRPPGTRGLEAYVRLLRALAKPELQPGDEILGVGTRWIAAAGSEAQHAWIADFLRSARTADAAAIHVQFTCYRTTEVEFQRAIAPALPPATGGEDGPHAYTAVLERGPKTEEFLAALDAHKAIEVLMAPGLAIEPLTIGEMSTHTQTAYVRDFDIRTEKGQIVCEPVVDVIEDGLTLDACVARLPGNRLGVSLGIAVADLQRPIPTAERTVPGTTQKVSLQLPQLRSTQLEGAFEMTSGQHVVLAPLPQGGQRHLFVVKVIDGDVERR